MILPTVIATKFQLQSEAAARVPNEIRKLREILFFNLFAYCPVLNE